MTRDELAAAGCAVSEAAYQRIALFLQRLLALNEQINLTAIREPALAWRRHVCDALAATPLLPNRDDARVLDLGTGGGVPGVVLACVRPELSVTLLDATRKKLTAIEEIIAPLNLAAVRCAWGRAETLAHEAAEREKYAVVLARAVAPLRVLVELASGFVKPGGRLVLWKTRRELDAEQADAAKAIPACKLKRLERVDYRVPDDEVDRVLVVYEKRGPLPARLPRAVGTPGKNPL